MKFLRSLIFHRYFPSVEIFQRSTLSKFTMKLLGISDSYRDFLSVEFFRGLYLVLSDETVEKFDFSSIFSECGIFQWSKLSTFLKKPSRNFVFYRYFLSVEFFRGPHSVHFDETLEKLDLPSIFTKCGITLKSTLSSFSMKLLGSSDSHRDFLSVEFFRGQYWVLSVENVEKFDFPSIFSECGIFHRSTLSTFLMKPMRSLIFHRYFLRVESSRGPDLIQTRWNFWDVRIFMNVFWMWNFWKV